MFCNRNMQFFAIICILLSVTAVGLAAEARGVFKNSGYPGKCYMSAALILSPGEEVKNPNIACGAIECQENSVAILQTCSVRYVEGYTEGDYVDASKPFPECCERKLTKTPE